MCPIKFRVQTRMNPLYARNKHMNAEKREALDKDAENLFAKMNKSDKSATEEFKLGVGWVDKPVAKIDSGVRKISETINKVVGKD